jgi:TonB-linked SusC/RagA family outer membrane protein
MKTSMDRLNPLVQKWARSSRSVCKTRTLLRTVLAAAMLIVPVSLIAQEATVTGRITDEVGTGIPGVNVVVKGTTNGTATDLEGRYTVKLNSDPQAILVISAIGYKTIEELIGERGAIDVQLAGDFTQLNEIVVTGYSTLMKKDVASSIAVVDVDDMKKIAASNIGDQLQGKIAGVQVSTSGGPGAFQYVRIRGIGTINNNEPLYVIDGVPVQNETNLNFLNPNDIETMQVLKDAAAASIYGARAANGVVVITTKRGTGRSKFSFDFFTGIQEPQNLPELATPGELLDIQKGLYAGAGRTFNSNFYLQDPQGNWQLPDFLISTKGYSDGDPEVDPTQYVLNTSDPSLYGQNRPIAAANQAGTDWFKELFKPAPMTNLQFSASGGNEKASHYFSLNYFNNKGILIANKWERLQARLNSTFAGGKNFRLGENLNVAFSTVKGSDMGGEIGNVMNAYTYLPIVPLYDIEGYWAAATQSSSVGQNPVAAQTRNAEGLNSHNLRITANVFAELDLFKNFSFRANVGMDYFERPYEKYYYTCPECARTGTNYLEKGWQNQRSWILTGTLNYNRTFGDHTLYSLAGWEMRDQYYEGFYAAGSGLKYGDDPYYRELTNVQSGTYLIQSSSSNSRMVSLFANINYTFRERYILSATVRRDGSSKFINNKYGVFPGVSAAWRISEEGFLRGSNFLSSLKLRASYGLTGNNEVLGGDYPGYTSYGTTPGSTSYAINGSRNSVTQGFAQVSSGNPDLKWETSRVLNFGFDATVMNNLDVTLEWYNRKTTDMILGVTQPLETGNTFPINQNIGSMQNNGIDLQLEYRGRWSEILSYTLGLTGSHYTNELLSLEGDATFINGVSLHGGYPPITRSQAGFPVSQYYGYVAEGLWTSQSQIETVLFTAPGDAKVGRMKFKDVNGDGQITSEDETVIGSPIPKFILGLNFTLNYKNFDFTAYFSGAFGQEVFNAVKAHTDFNSTNVLLSGSNNRSKRMLYEAGSRLPVLDVDDTYSGNISSYFVEDASFFRCRNVVLGYSVPQRIISKARLTKTRFYFQAQNLFLITNYSGMDPDVTVINMEQGNQPKRDLSTGIDVGRLPWSRQLILGVNIEF